MNNNLPVNIQEKKTHSPELLSLLDRPTITKESPKSKSSFLQNSSASLKSITFNQENLYIWNSAYALDTSVDIYSTGNYKFISQAGIYSFDRIDGNSSGNSYEVSLRFQNDKSDDETWGYQLHASANSQKIYGNPLARGILSLQIDYTKKYNKYRFSSAIKYSGKSTSSGTLDIIQNPNITTINQYGYSELTVEGREIYDSYTNYGSIITYDINIEKEWTQNLITNIGFTAHKMNNYRTTLSERITIDDEGEELDFGFTEETEKGGYSLPILTVLNLGASYMMGDSTLLFKYSKLLNSPTANDIGEVNLTTLGDPISRGLGNSNLTLTLAVNF
jgi:hypothetical protein